MVYSLKSKVCCLWGFWACGAGFKAGSWTALKGLGDTLRPQSSSFLGLPYRILNMKPKKELLWGLWVSFRAQNLSGFGRSGCWPEELDV